MGTFFYGHYVLDPINKEPTLYDYGIFHLQAQDQKFQQLTGSDYQAFVDNMQLISEEYDSHMKATVFEGGVRGLYTIMEGTVIVGDDGHYYGAVIKKGSTIHYYTTNPAYKNKLPNPIKLWKERFNDYPVKSFYKNV